MKRRHPAALRDNPAPTEEHVRVALRGNLCRCTGYDTIVDAVLAASRTTGPAPDNGEV